MAVHQGGDRKGDRQRRARLRSLPGRGLALPGVVCLHPSRHAPAARWKAAGFAGRCQISPRLCGVAEERIFHRRRL